MELAIRLLGPFELVRHGTVVAAGGPTQRALLAMLALRAGQPVGIDDLVDGIWGERDAPSGGRSTIWPHVSRIRASLRDNDGQPLATVGSGYRLELSATAVDAHDFERLLRVGREQLADGKATTALASLDQALALWRGPALMDVRDFPFAAAVAVRYDELRVDAAEERVEARLALGEGRSLVPDLQALISDHPYRERLRGQLMIALYRAGQQVAALDAYRAARRQLTMDLGVEPGPELEHLHQQILRHADELATATHASSGPAAGRPTPTPHRQLPRALDLIGRSEQLRQLERLTDRERLITLTGAGGIGKTALAVAAAHRLAPRFTDGAAFVDLAAVSHPQQVIPAISGALGLSPSVAQPLAQLADFLAERHMLVLLDNFEHVLQAAPDLEPIVEATGGLVLATSRAPLGLRTEYLVEVTPLPVPFDADSEPSLARQPAAQLFVRASAAAGGALGASPEELAAIRDICRSVDGLPLAIEIAAAQTRVIAVEELAQQIRNKLPELHGRVRDAPARQQTLEAAIGWSIELLDAAQRPQLSRLAAFAGSFGASGAAAVCDLDHDRAIELLGALLDASLLTRRPAIEGRARFRMLEPVRAVVRSRAEPELQADAAERQATFMLAEIDRLCPTPTGIERPGDLAELRVEHQDLIAALTYLTAADPDRGARAIRQLHDYWTWTAREADAKHICDGLLRGGRLSDGAACEVLVEGAWCAIALGQLEDARRAIDQACTLVATVRDPAVLGLVRMYEALFGLVSGDVERGRAAARTAVRYAREAGASRILALSLAARALMNPHATAAARWLDEALRVARAGPMPEIEAWVMFSSAAAKREQDMAAAIDLERSALEICRRFRSPESSLTNALSGNLGSHLLRSGSIDEARSLALASLHSAERLGHRTWSSVALELVGEVEAALGRADRAIALITASRAIVARLGVTGMETDEERRRVAQVVAGLEARIGDDAAEKARRQGEAMGYREAIAYAFETDMRRRGRPRHRVRARARRPICGPGAAQRWLEDGVD